MAQVAANVAAGAPVATGGILAGPIGTALPTTEVAVLNVAIKALGYVGDSGLESSGDAPSINDIAAWGGDKIASIVTDKGTRKFKFTLLEIFNSETAKAVFGTANVTVTAAATGVPTKLAIQDKLDTGPLQVFVFDMKYEGKLLRIVTPRGKLVVTQERPFVGTDLVGYECEVTCLPDSNGVRTYRYYANDDAL